MIERAEARKEPTFVVDGLLPTGLGVFAGASKIGKSFGVLDICFGVANGSPVLGGMVCSRVTSCTWPWRTPRPACGLAWTRWSRTGVVAVGLADDLLDGHGRRCPARGAHDGVG